MGGGKAADRRINSAARSEKATVPGCLGALALLAV